MSETKTYVFPESGGSGGGNGMMAMLAPLLQQKGIDPNLLVAMQGKNNNGFGGDGSWFMWIIFLFFLFPLFGRNGWGNNGDGGNGGGFAGAGIPNLINNDAGRELLMSVTVRSLNRLLHAAAKTVWRSVSKQTHCKMPLTVLRLVRKEALLLLHMKLNVRLVICKIPSRIAPSRFLPASVRLKCVKCRTRLINFVRRIAHLRVLL